MVSCWRVWSPWLVGTALLAFPQASAEESGIAVDMGDGTMCADDFCFPKPPDPYVSSLSPASGPLDGGTAVVVVGTGFRDFGELMKCGFGVQSTSASLTAPEGEFIDVTNHDQLACHSPAATSE